MIVEIGLPAKTNWQIKMNPFIFKYKDDTFELLAGENGIVDYIQIKRQINPHEKTFSDGCREFKKTLQNQLPWSVNPVEKQLMDNLRFFENVLCIEGVIRLNWDGVRCTNHPENQDEDKLIKSEEVPRGWGSIIHEKGNVIIEDPKALTCRLEYSEGLQIELNFFRHANIAMNEKNCIEAFFNFYLILESYFSGGQWRNQEAIFAKNKRLTDIITELLKEDKFKRHFKGNIMGEINTNAVIRRLVEVRKKLFHFLDINNPDRNVHYGNQEEYKRDTFALSHIVWVAMRRRHYDSHPEWNPADPRSGW